MRDALTGCPERALTPPEHTMPIADRCCICKEHIYVGEVYFDFDGDAVHEDCVSDYVKRFRRFASESD